MHKHKLAIQGFKPTLQLCTDYGPPILMTHVQPSYKAQKQKVIVCNH
jgi:hypothetical protein